MLFARQALGSLVTLVFGVVASIVLTRALGAEARGEYGLVVRTAGLVLAVAQLGIQEALLQFVGERRAPLGDLVGTSAALGVAGVLAAGVVLLGVQPALAGTVLRGVDPSLLAVAIVGCVLSILGLVARRFIQLEGGIAVYNGLDVGRSVLFLLLAVALAATLPGVAGGAVGVWFVGELVIAVAALLYLRRRIIDHWAFDGALARRLVVAGAPVEIGLLATYLGNEAGPYILNPTLGLAEAGRYFVVLGVARLVIQVSMALRTALGPRLVQPGVESGQMTAEVTRHGVLWMLLVAVGLAAGSPLLPLVYGSDFAAATPILVLLLPGMVLYGVMQLLASHLLRVGQRAVLALSSCVLAVASIGLQVLGTAWAGPAGAAVGLSVAYGLALLVVVRAFTRASGISPRKLLPSAADLAAYPPLLRTLASRVHSARLIA